MMTYSVLNIHGYIPFNYSWLASKNQQLELMVSYLYSSNIRLSSVSHKELLMIGIHYTCCLVILLIVDYYINFNEFCMRKL